MSARITVEMVQRLESLIGGDPIMEQWVLDFIQAKYQSRNLLFLPDKVTDKIIERPDDFLAAVKKHQTQPF